MLSFLLVPLYTTKGVLSSVAEYGEISVIFSYFVIFNVVLAYGMETAFFRFFNKEENKEKEEDKCSCPCEKIIEWTNDRTGIKDLLEHEVFSKQSPKHKNWKGYFACFGGMSLVFFIIQVWQDRKTTAVKTLMMM